jgi:hypothetical protein
MKSQWVASAAAGLALCGAISIMAAEPEDALDVVKVRKNFYMIAGAGGNIGVQIGSDGVVLVNSGTGAASGRGCAGRPSTGTDRGLGTGAGSGARPRGPNSGATARPR